ncbi:MAG: small nuclear ribonucleoprotein [Methanosarcinaceae archaeon]|nr:small nuclear ribonucleoprotein [Methanosarcinaceae archaeon]
MANRPLDALNEWINSSVTIRQKGGREFTGILKGYDVHMNVVLENAEGIKDEKTQSYKSLVIRGDTIVYVSPKK